MDYREYEILKFMAVVDKPLEINDFPKNISGLFNSGANRGSLLYAIDITLRNSGFIKRVNATHFVLTESGKFEYQSQKAILNEEEQLNKINDQKLKDDAEYVAKINRDYDETRKRAINAERIAKIALTISLITLCLSVIKLLLSR